MTERPLPSKWDARMLDLVHLVGSWSKDPSTRVGAAIVDQKNRIVSVGFNGFPRAVHDTDDLLTNRDKKLRRTIHAEENALLFAGRSVEGCTVYLTHQPCSRCAAKLIQAGVYRIVCAAGDKEFSTRWADDISAAVEMLDEACVQFDVIEYSNAQSNA